MPLARRCASQSPPAEYTPRRRLGRRSTALAATASMLAAPAVHWSCRSGSSVASGCLLSLHFAISAVRWAAPPLPCRRLLICCCRQRRSNGAAALLAQVVKHVVRHVHAGSAHYPAVPSLSSSVFCAETTALKRTECERRPAPTLNPRGAAVARRMGATMRMWGAVLA